MVSGNSIAICGIYAIFVLLPSLFGVVSFAKQRQHLINHYFCRSSHMYQMGPIVFGLKTGMEMQKRNEAIIN